MRFDRGTGRYLTLRVYGGGGSAPAAPDPYATAAAQTQQNQQTAAYNQAMNTGNVYTPLGSSTFTPRTDPTTGATIYDQKISLDPTQQQLLDLQNKQDLNLGNLSNSLIEQSGANFGKPIDTSMLDTTGSYSRGVDTSNLPQLVGANDLEGARKQIQDALYQKQTAMLDPQYQQREQQLQSRLAAQGITQNSEAWNNALDEFNRARGFDYGQARDSSIASSGDEMTRLAGIASSNRGQLFGEGQTNANMNNATQSQLLSDALQRFGANMSAREAPLNELNAIRGATQVNVPNFAPAGGATTNPADIMGAMNQQYQGQLGSYNAGVSSNNAMLGGLAGTAGMAIMVF